MKNRKAIDLFGKEWPVHSLGSGSRGPGFEIEMISDSAPEMSFEFLLKISEYFGTTQIDVDHYSESGGCPTCGYGSTAGYELQIYNATKNNPFPT